MHCEIRKRAAWSEVLWEFRLLCFCWKRCCKDSVWGSSCSQCEAEDRNQESSGSRTLESTCTRTDTWQPVNRSARRK